MVLNDVYLFLPTHIRLKLRNTKFKWFIMLFLLIAYEERCQGQF
jgi:hypothetical protein